MMPAHNGNSYNSDKKFDAKIMGRWALITTGWFAYMLALNDADINFKKDSGKVYGNYFRL